MAMLIRSINTRQFNDDRTKIGIMNIYFMSLAHTVTTTRLFIYPLISGAIVSLAFSISGFWLLGFVAFTPFLFFLYHTKTTPMYAFIGGILFGVVFFGWTLSWFWGTYPLAWAGIQSNTVSFLVIFILWLLSSFIFSLSIGLWALVFKIFLEKRLWRDTLFASFLWILFEYAGAFAISIFWAGPSSVIGTQWTFSFLGYLLSENQFLLSLASFGGIYLLGFLVIAINIIIFFITRNIPSRKEIEQIILIVMILLSFVVIASVNLHNAPKEAPMTVALLTTTSPTVLSASAEKIATHKQKIESLLVQLKKDDVKPDILILPEHSSFFPSMNTLERNSVMKDIFGEKEALIIDSGGTRDQKNTLRSTVFYYNTLREGSSYYNKILLVPYGEFLPYVVSFIATIVGEKEWVASYSEASGFQKGMGVATGTVGNIKVGTLFCSEAASTSLYRTLTNDGSSLLVNVASHSFAKGSRILYREALALAKVRAVENNRYFAQAMNGAPSFIVTNTGVVAKESEKGVASVLYGTIYPIRTLSVYARFGNWILLLALLCILLRTRYAEHSIYD